MPTTLNPVQAESVRARAETGLRDAITGGELRAGARLIKRELCASDAKIKRPAAVQVLAASLAYIPRAA